MLGYRLSNHVTRGNNSKAVTDLLEIVSKAVAYLANVAVETIRTTAKSAALLSSTRRAIWVKSWEGTICPSHSSVGCPLRAPCYLGLT